MTKTLSLALKKVGELPDAAQEEIGLELLEYVADLQEVRAKLQEGVRALDAGQRIQINPKKFIAQMRKRYVTKK
ncbi:hypothetical protein HY968_01940 [Candidatus Kaiserbacteria bacterium]|nr:hypothetical protein [Candidatus Kaiserbacteria bacterium]